MTITAVIAEYNPLHKGHAYHLQEARRATDADFLLVIMSGNFVQRGEPAIIDKFARAQAAVLCGADLVLELPVCYAGASAEYFAGAAVSLINALGCVDYLCFGSESGSLPALGKIADILADEPQDYRAALRDALKTGVSYPKARAQVLCQIFRRHGDGGCLTGFSDEAFLSLLSSPNDILGIEYIRALKKSDSPVKPVAIPRVGNGYHEQSLAEPFVSASALRAALRRSAFADSSHTASSAKAALPESLPDSILSLFPGEITDLFQSAYRHTFPVFANDFSSVLQYRLLCADGWEELAQYFDVPETLARRIFQLRYQFTDFDSFAALVCTRNLTETHVRRALLHILLGVPANLPGLAQYRCYYARPLALRKAAQPLLSAIKKSGRLPLISKLADARHILSSYPYFSAQERRDALAFFTADLQASELYQTALTARFGMPAVSEYTRPLCVLP